MNKKAFIQADKKQWLGALLAKYAINKHAPDLPVEIMLVEDVPVFQEYSGREYNRAGGKRKLDPNDLQFFTLTRFMPPELMDFEGRALVIDPDIFALADVTELLDIDLGGKSIAACENKGFWDTSVMVLDNQKLQHWVIADLLEKLTTFEIEYMDLFALKQEDVKEISRKWNSCDLLEDDTKMLHTTTRLTQPWKTGLPIDFTRNKMPKFFGIIPREPVHKLLGRYPTHYLPNPDQRIVDFFFSLLKEAVEAGAISTEEVQHEIDSGHVRKDAFEVIEKL